MGRDRGLFVVLVMAGTLMLAGCHTTEWLTPEEYQKNPRRLQDGDSLTVYTKTGGAIKSKLVHHSADGIELKDGRTMKLDEISSIQIRRANVTGNILIGLVIVAGVALIVAAIIGYGHLTKETAKAPQPLPRPGPALARTRLRLVLS